jgi:hypothetical protein
MSVHRYQMRNLWSDYARGMAGMAIGIGGWSLAPDSTHMIVIFGVLTLLFLVFTLRTFVRQQTWVELSDDAISVGRARRRALRWRDLDRIRLRYFSTRRNRGNGWMVMDLRTPSGRISLDSAIDGFDAIAARAARAARETGLKLDKSSAANMAALGQDVAVEESPFDGRATEGMR